MIKLKNILNERVDYKYLTQVILDAKPKQNVYYNSSRNVVNIGGVGYDKGDLVQNFNQKPGSSGKIKNNFYNANQNPEETKKEIEKLSRGKIKVDIQKGYGGKPVVVYIVKEGKLNEAMGKYMIGPKVVSADKMLSYMYSNPSKPISQDSAGGPPKWYQTNSVPETDRIVSWDTIEVDMIALEKKYGKGNVVVSGNTRGGDPVINVYVKSW